MRIKFFLYSGNRVVSDKIPVLPTYLSGIGFSHRPKKSHGVITQSITIKRGTQGNRLKSGGPDQS